MTTALDSVTAIINSDAFQQGARDYWSHAPMPKNRAAALRSLRIFTEVEIKDQSVAGHRRIKDELQRMFDYVERLRAEGHWSYSQPERQPILGMLSLENVLLEAAEIAEEI